MAAPLRPPARLSAVCFAMAALSFLTGCLLAYIAAPDLLTFFYQPRALAATHAFTLGWISLMMMGVLYQYVPALTKRGIVWPRLAAWQVGIYATGVAGLLPHFWIGAPGPMAWTAGMIFASVGLFVAQLAPPLWRAEQRDATVIGIAAALTAFLLTATLGFLYGLDKVYSFLPGSVLSNIAAHAHLGLLGWISMTICAVSYRMVAAFVLPEVLFPASARRQIVALGLSTAALVVALLARSRAAVPLGVAVVLALGWYAQLIWRLLRTRRMPLDWSLAHVLAALVHLAGAAACGLALLVVVDPSSEIGSRVAVAYGILILLGWITNVIVGIGTRMLPGLIGAGAQPLLSPFARVLVFSFLNAGAVGAASAALAGNVDGFRAALGVLLVSAATFGSAVARRARRTRS